MRSHEASVVIQFFLTPKEQMGLPAFSVDGRSIRVAYFAGSMRPNHDGVTRVLYAWVEELKRLGIEHRFFSPIIPPPPEQIAPMSQIPSVTIPLYKDYRLARPGYGHFEHHLNVFKPDLIHINSPCTLGYAALQRLPKRWKAT